MVLPLQTAVLLTTADLKATDFLFVVSRVRIINHSFIFKKQQKRLLPIVKIVRPQPGEHDSKDKALQ
jgi:hypothetical protein